LTWLLGFILASGVLYVEEEKNEARFSPEVMAQMVAAFLVKYEVELGTIPQRVTQLDNPEYRSQLAHTDPVLSKVVEGHTRNEIIKTLENVALASAVVEAVQVAFQKYS
jgi:hypothetical protein